MTIQYKRNNSSKITDHFKHREFDCQCGCATTKHDPALSRKLEQLRKQIDTPITITSGYRCKARNKAVGGSNGSKHTTGQAADIKAKLNPVALGILAQQHFKGVGIYWYGSTAFIHVDTRSTKATWLCISSGIYRYTSLNKFIMPTIKKGSTGATNKAATRMLQRLLGIKADGTFGAGTEKAVRGAQRKYGLKVDGIVGPATWRHVSGAVQYL